METQLSLTARWQIWEVYSIEVVESDQGPEHRHPEHHRLWIRRTAILPSY